MSTRARGELPYKLTAGAVPCSQGWLLVSARLRGTTFAPDFPRVNELLIDIVTRRPAFSIVTLNAPIGDLEAAFAARRGCDLEAERLVGRRVVDLRRSRALGVTSTDETVGYLDDRYREVAKELAPFLQRSIVESLPELSFYQLNGERSIESDPHSDPGYLERRELLVKVPGVSRILDTVIEGVTKFQLLEASALLWSARRITSRAGKRVPPEPAWDDDGLRLEILR